MSDYKRLTKQAGWHKDIDLKDELGYSYIYQRLAELENKIEKGTLIELPCVRERKGYPNQYEAVYEINGVVQSCVVGSVKEGWRIIAYYGEDRAKVEAEKRLKELQNV